MSGAGIQGAGISPAGVGDPAYGLSRGGSFLRDPTTGKVAGARRIDPRTRDYVFDANGRIVGMNATQQKVLLCCSTDEGSSAVTELGQRLKNIKVIGSGFAREVREAFAYALRRMTSSGEISLLSVTPERFGTTGAYILVRFRDLRTNKVEQVQVR